MVLYGVYCSTYSCGKGFQTTILGIATSEEEQEEIYSLAKQEINEYGRIPDPQEEYFDVDSSYKVITKDMFHSDTYLGA